MHWQICWILLICVRFSLGTATTWLIALSMQKKKPGSKGRKTTNTFDLHMQNIKLE